MQSLAQSYRKRGYLLATGQATSYDSGIGVDDGALRKGIVKTYTVLTLGQYSGTTNITINSKTDVHNNACVFDNNTGLIWSQTVSGSVGPTSDGKLPWTTTGSGATAEGIFPYCAAANVALLAGYGDWRVSNIAELSSLVRNVSPGGLPDSVAFPVFPAAFVWSSSTQTTATANGLGIAFSSGIQGGIGKINAVVCLLVRG